MLTWSSAFHISIMHHLQGQEVPDDAMSGPTKEQTRDDKHHLSLLPQIGASTHPFSMPEWVESLVIGGAKSSTLRDEALPSFLEEVLPENKLAGISSTRMTRKDRLEVWDEEMWCDAMKMVHGSELGPGFM
jgi:hypothetical protein